MARFKTKEKKSNSKLDWLNQRKQTKQRKYDKKKARIEHNEPNYLSLGSIWPEGGNKL